MRFRREDEAFDFPDITFGDNFVYLTANLMKHGGALILRMPITDIATRGTINARYASSRTASTSAQPS